MLLSLSKTPDWSSEEKISQYLGRRMNRWGWQEEKSGNKRSRSEKKRRRMLGQSHSYTVRHRIRRKQKINRDKERWYRKAKGRQNNLS